MLTRRLLLAALAASALMPGSARAGESILAYTPGLVAERLAAGETVFVDFYAPWCGTCRAQHRVLDKLKAENPGYGEAVTFVQVDWDTYRSDPFTKGLNIPRRSTLVVLKGDDELGRTVAGTSEAEIKALLDAALGAATAS